MQNVVKNEKLQMMIIALATAIGAEFKINPFSNDFFRIGLGVSIFLFFLLLMPHLPYVKTGILTGILSVIFQSGEWITQMNSFLCHGEPAAQCSSWLILCCFCIWPEQNSTEDEQTRAPSPGRLRGRDRFCF